MDVQSLTTIPTNWADPIFSAEQAQNLLHQPYHHLFVIQGGGHVLATLPAGMAADILTIYVPPEARRTGHAKSLLTFTINAAQAAGCTGLTLEVNAENTAALGLYSVCGLQQVAKRAAYYPPNSQGSVSNLKADALVLALTFA